MRFFIPNTDYVDFLRWLYAEHPGLEWHPYDAQMRVRTEALFGMADSCSSNLRKLGHEAWDIHANNEFMQKAWVREHGFLPGPDRRWGFRLRRKMVPWMSRVKVERWLYDILLDRRPDQTVMFTSRDGSGACVGPVTTGLAHLPCRG